MIRHKICKVCNVEFQAKSNKGIYCTFVCRDAAYKARNPDKAKKRRNNWYGKNKEQINEHRREHQREWNRIYWAKRRATDVKFKLKNNLRNRLNAALKNNSCKSSVLTYIGCSIDELKEYLESKFELGMTWDNHSSFGWHIDHIKPLNSFSCDDQDLYKSWHYTNLQPLWAKDNLKKGSKC